MHYDLVPEGRPDGPVPQTIHRKGEWKAGGVSDVDMLERATSIVQKEMKATD